MMLENSPRPVGVDQYELRDPVRSHWRGRNSGISWLVESAVMKGLEDKVKIKGLENPLE